MLAKLIIILLFIILIQPHLHGNQLPIKGVLGPRTITEQAAADHVIIVPAPVKSTNLQAKQLLDLSAVRRLVVSFRFFKGEPGLSSESCILLGKMSKLLYEELNLPPNKRTAIPPSLRCKIVKGQLVKEEEDHDKAFAIFGNGNRNNPDEDLRIDQALILENALGEVTPLEMAYVLRETLSIQLGSGEQPPHLLETMVKNPSLALTFIAFVEEYSRDILGREISEVFKNPTLVDSIIAKILEIFPFISRSEQAQTTRVIIQFFFDIREYIETKANRLKSSMENEDRKSALAYANTLSAKKKEILFYMLQNAESNALKAEVIEFSVESLQSSHLNPTEYIEILKLLPPEIRLSEFKKTIQLLDLSEVTPPILAILLEAFEDKAKAALVFLHIQDHIPADNPTRKYLDDELIKHLPSDFITQIYLERMHEPTMNPIELRAALTHFKALTNTNKLPTSIEINLLHWLEAGLHSENDAKTTYFLTELLPVFLENIPLSLMQPVLRKVILSDSLRLSNKSIALFKDYILTDDIAFLLLEHQENLIIKMGPEAIASLAIQFISIRLASLEVKKELIEKLLELQGRSSHKHPILFTQNIHSGLPQAFRTAEWASIFFRHDFHMKGSHDDSSTYLRLTLEKGFGF